MILNHPFVLFDGFGVIFEKEIESSLFDMGFNEKMPFRRTTNHFLHFLNGLSPSFVLCEEKGNIELGLLGPLAVGIEADQFSIGLHRFFLHPFSLVVIPQLHQGLTGEVVLGVSFQKIVHPGNKRVKPLFLNKTEEDSKIGLGCLF